MNVLSYFMIIFLMISIMLNVGFNYNPSFLGSLSLKNISIYSIVIFILLQKIFLKKSFKETHEISHFICIYIFYSFFLLILKKIQLNEYSNLFELLIPFKSGFDAFIIFILIDYLVLDRKYIDKLIFYLVLIFFILNFVTVLDSFGMINIDRIHFDMKYGRSAGAFGESNVYASYVSSFIPLIVVILLNAKEKYYFIFTSINLLFGIYALLLTGSRGGFLSMLISMLILYGFTKKKLLNYNYGRYIALTVVVIISFIVVVKTIPELTAEGLEKNFVSRYESSDLNDYSSGRLDLWAKGLSLFVENPFLGAEKGFVKIIGSNSHNTYLEILVNRGLFGFLLFLSIFFIIYKKNIYFYKKMNMDDIYSAYIAGFFSFIISMFFLNMFSAFYFFFLYSSLVVKKGVLDDLNPCKEIL